MSHTDGHNDEYKEMILNYMSDFKICISELCERCLQSCDAEKRLSGVEQRLAFLEYAIEDNYAPSPERDVCLATPYEKWMAVISFDIQHGVFTENALEFLAKMANNCASGWQRKISNKQARWAVELIKKYEDHEKEEERKGLVQRVKSLFR